MGPLRVALLAALALGSQSAFAQDERGYVGGGLAISTWSSRTSPESSPSLTFASSTGATVPGLAIEGGVPLGSRLAVGGEVVVPARQDWTQVSGYLFGRFQREIRYRDLTVAAIARVHTAAAARLRGAVVAGFEVVRQDALQRRAEGHIDPNGSIVFDALGAVTQVNGWTGGAVVGAEGIVAVNEHVVPAVRLHLIARDDVTTTIGSLNVAPVVVRAGVGLRATF